MLKPELLEILACPACKGARLRPEALAVTVGDRPISEIASWPVTKLLTWLDDLTLGKKEKVRLTFR